MPQPDKAAIPGTSSVHLSLSTPILHFDGRDFIPEPLSEAADDKAGFSLDFSFIMEF